MDRRQRLLGGADVQAGLGIEIGALHAPLLVRSEGRVVYVDYAPTEMLRANMRHPGVDPADVVPVDVVWGGEKLRDAVGEAANIIVASHVVEHVPDLIGWLAELHAALRQGGILGLAVPDRRATFDAWRNDSTVAEMVEAHLAGRRQPGIAQIFEAATHCDAAALAHPWRGEHGAALPDAVLARLKPVYAWVKSRTHASPYADAHCWVFTPHSFLLLSDAMARIGCLGFAIDGFYPTEPGEIEFQVRLRAVAMGDPAIASSIEQARAALPDAVPMAVAVLRAELAAVYRSRSWRLTAPLRALARKLAGKT